MTTMFSDYHGDLMFATSDTFFYVAPSSRLVTYDSITLGNAFLGPAL